MQDIDSRRHEPGNSAPGEGLTGDGAVLQPDRNRVKRSRPQIESTEKLLAIGLLIFAFPIWYVGTKTWSRLWPPAASHEALYLPGNPETAPEVRNATRGEWTEVSGWWSKFGILGAGFDGEEIVFNSAESEHGSLGCWVSLRARPLRGYCYESSSQSDPRVRGRRVCSWQLVVDEISTARIRGSRVLNSGGSDQGCTGDYGSLPSSFNWERPNGPTAPAS